MAKKPKLTSLFDNFDNGVKELEFAFIQIDKLKFTPRNTFDLYDGGRLEEMKKSIDTIGVLAPLLVQKDSDGLYEVISGNNRLNVAKVLGLKELPVRIIENLTDTEKDIIIAETNLNQRNFTDLNYTQRAKVIYNYYNAIKKQGKRTDLIEVENLDEKQPTNKGFNLGTTQMWKYSKFHTLIEPIKKLVDETDKLTFSLAVDISNLSKELQEHLYTLIIELNFNVSKKDIKTLKEISNENVNFEKVKKILNNEPKKTTVIKNNKTKKSKGDNQNQSKNSNLKNMYTISQEIVDKYIPKNISTDKKDEMVIEAFELYFGNSDKE